MGELSTVELPLAIVQKRRRKKEKKEKKGELSRVSSVWLSRSERKMMRADATVELS